MPYTATDQAAPAKTAAVVQFPPEAKVEELDAKHPDYEKYESVWSDLRLMYESGAELHSKAADLIIRRPTEPTDAYDVRKRFIGHGGHLGTAIGWYEAALYSKDPQIDKRLNDKAVADDDPLSEKFSEFEKDCDQAGTKLIDFFKAFSRNLILYGRAWRLIDLPGDVNKAETRADQKKKLKPYLVRYEAPQVINWGDDENGVLEWVMISIQRQGFTDDFPRKPLIIDCWYYFDRTSWARYERVQDGKEQDPKDTADLADQGRHALSDEQKVPVDRVVLPEALWLANRAYLPAIAHLNAENWLLWILYLCNCPMPVVTGDVESSIQVAEYQWIKLAAGGKFEWTEPQGSSIERLIAAIEKFLEEIFRAMYLIAQARSISSTPAAQSGISKQMDMVPSYEVLAAIGDVIREAIERTYRDYLHIIGKDEVEPSVSGFNFKERDSEKILGMASQVQTLNVPSDTLRKEIFKMIAHEVLGPDPDKDVLDQILEEIEKAPTAEEQKQNDLEMQAKAKQLDASFKSTSDLGGDE